MDCANGVGAIKLNELLYYIGDSLSVKIVNDETGKANLLNNNCGADHVKVTQSKPTSLVLASNERCCSLDGDADRIVYYYEDLNHRLVLLDGDRIAILAADYMMELIKLSKLTINGLPVKVGIVQTAYANGSATAYVKNNLVF